jgi:FkbM family methyltransferase
MTLQAEVRDRRRDHPRFKFKFRGEDLCIYQSVADSEANVAWVKRLGTGGVLLDLGANIGEIARCCHDQFDRVVCVDANPLTCRIADARLRGIGNVAIVNAAVAPDDAPATYWVSNPSPASIGSTARRDKKYKNYDRGYYFKVATTSLARLVTDYHPRVVKMDIEGGEYEVLAVEQASAYESLTDVELLLVEFHRRRDPRVPLIIDRVIDFGFRIVNFGEIFSATTWATMTILFARPGITVVDAVRLPRHGK